MPGTARRGHNRGLPGRLPVLSAQGSVQFSRSVMSDSFDPMDCSTPGLPVHHQLPEFTQSHVHQVGDAIQPSHPLSSPSPPALNLSQHPGLFHRVALHNNLTNSFSVSFKTSFEISWSFVNSLTSWLTACLAVFRCAKIASFSYPVFFWLKWVVSWSRPRLLLGAPILSSPSVILSATRPPVLRQMVATQGSHGNHTMADRRRTVSLYLVLPHVILRWSVPLLLSLESTLSLMFSPRDPSSGAHTVALQPLAFFLIICYTSCSLSLAMAVTNIARLQEVLTYAGMCLHSSFLARGSPKLRRP